MKLYRKTFNTMPINHLLLLIVVVSVMGNVNTFALSQNSDNTPEEIQQMNIIVKDGDSLSKLATTYGITVRELMELNMLSSTSIKTGLSLIVPIASSTALALNNNPVSDKSVSLSDRTINPQTTTFETITVAAGDTLSSLAISYGSSIEAIQSQNELSDYIIFSGQKLDIPLERSLTISANDRLPDALGYITVLPNDTISALATTFCSSPELLMGQNNLLQPDIFVGQRLFVGQLDSITAMVTNQSSNSTVQ